MKSPSGRLSGDGSAQARRHVGAFGGRFPQNVFCSPSNFVVPRKICFKPKMYFPLQMLKPGYGPG